MGAFVPALVVAAFVLHLPIIRFIIPHFLEATPAAAAAPAAAPAATPAFAFFFLDNQLNIPGFLGALGPATAGAFCVVSSFLFKNPGFFLKTPPRLACCEVFKNPGFFLKTPPRLGCCGGGPALVPVEVEVLTVKKAGFFLFLVGMNTWLELA